MAGNFRGVLIFVIFMVDLAVTKFFHPQKLMPTWRYYASPWWWAWPKTSWQRGQHFPVLASNSSHCHSADCVFGTNILLSQAICPGLLQKWLSNKEDRARVSITSSLVQYHTPGLVAVTKFKIMKINSEGLLWLSTKISTPENYPPYGIILVIIGEML